ncbi:MAG: hypothetical protein R2715_11765 [Ilumatobacteraceae bacterium]
MGRRCCLRSVPPLDRERSEPLAVGEDAAEHPDRPRPDDQHVDVHLDLHIHIHLENEVGVDGWLAVARHQKIPS